MLGFLAARNRASLIYGGALMRKYGEQDGREKRVKAASASGVSYDADFLGYINVALTQDQKTTYEKWVSSASYWETFSATVADGVQLSVKIDPKSGGFIASATQRRTDSPNAGLVVTARGREPEVAFGRLLFTLAYLGRAEKWTDLQPMADPDRW